MDKSWIRKSRLSAEYFDGVNDFLNFAFEKSSQDGKILCPCSRCSNINWHTREIVKEHLVCNGFLLGYTHWACHGESISSSSSSSNTTYHLQDPSRLPESTHDQIGSSRHDDMEGLLRDALRMHFQDSDNLSSLEDIPNVQNIRAESNEHCDIGLDRQEPTDEPNIGASNFYKLLEDGKQELYPGCTKFSKLSFIVHLFHLKCLNGWSSKSFTMLLELLNDAFPNGTTLPKSTYDAKKFIKDLGLGYEKINSCPNDCILYWGDRSNEQSCDVCGASRWLSTATENASNDEMGNEERKGRPAKVLRYFPLIPRLQRLFMSPKTSDYMRWHDEGRTKDGLLRHPADSLAWRSFDSRYKDFSSDSRNVRLGLATDGFNPFRAMNTSYSMWPVILIPYNLPPWICMKQSSFILSMIIPGPKGPGNNIDVYLQPLIEELKQLWEGVDTYDASRKDNFHMRATLLWTISDFPAYANLSGWSTKGRYACPCCVDKTCSRWLYNGKKFCYMGHRRWLSETHKFRYQKHLFDGTEELRSAPTPISGTDVLKQVEGINFRYGKVPYSARNKASINTQSKKRMKKQFDNSQDHESQSYNLEAIGIESDGDEDEDDFNNISLWKKKSIFFMLPYWKHNLLRHNLDMMHTEKNVDENVCGTILNEDGKSKDNVKSRLDLVDMDIRHELHPQLLPNGKTYLPFACYLLSREERDVFCKVLKDIKVPDGFASNISRCVNLKEHRLLSLKSHDYHILMQDLLPLALRASMTTEVASILIELSNIFKSICSKVLNVEDLEQLQHRAAITLCHLEKIFPPSFFTIMVHLIIHLPEQAKLGGPVHYRWMYPIERNLFKLKSHVRNKAHPEGSIAEEYLVEECLLFCSRYLEGVETRFNRPARNYDIVRDEHSIPYLFLTAGQPIGEVDVITLDEMAWAQAHRYILFHHNMVEPFRNEYIRILRARSHPRRLQNHKLDRLLIEQFHEWFGDHVSSQSDVADEVRWLARGPNKIAKRYKGFIINGFRFHTKDRERNKRTQNSGVVVTSSIRSYATARDANPLEGNVDYYGILTDIIELDYYEKFRVVLFRCDWADVTSSRGVRKDQFGFTTVNFSRSIHTGEQLRHEPFVFFPQVKQVFYSQDPKNVDWYVVLHKAPRDLFDMGEKSNDEDFEVHNECMPFTDQHLDENFKNWVRLDVAEDIHSN